MIRHDEFRRGRCEAVREGTSKIYYSILDECLLFSDTLPYIAVVVYTVTITLLNPICNLEALRIQSKMFIPHIPVASSSLASPGSLYPRSRQGKVAELRMELNSGGRKDKNHSAKKIALKKIVANMTMSNNDMVALFPDIVSCMQIPSLEIKKM